MDQRLRTHLRDQGGTISARAAGRLGLTPNDLRRLVVRGELVRVARGAYVDARLLVPADPATAHRLRARAVVSSREGLLAASHQSAAVLLGLPVLRSELEPLRVVHTSSAVTTRRHDAFTVHRCPGPEALTTVAGVACVVPALAVLGTATAAGVSSGIMAADAALRAGLVTEDGLRTWLERLAGVPGVTRARHVVASASGLAESPGESLLRLVLLELGHEVVAQHLIRRPGGLVARVDFYLPRLGVVVEFDGRVKYAGADGPAALAAEKDREDDLRSLGHGVARVVWSDLAHPQRVQAKILAAARTRAA